MDKTPKVQWQPIVELVVVLLTILGSTIPLYLHTDSKIEENRKETHSLLTAIQTEMRDFHGRLCAIEERQRK